MEKNAWGAVIPFYGAAAVWVLGALFFPLYAPGHFVLAAILSAAVFLVLRAVAGDKTAPAKPVEEEKPTGNKDLDEMVKNGNLALAEMRRLDDSIADETISRQIRQLEDIAGKIFRQVRENPDKLPQIRRFMDYYLPTTLKLLNAYDRMGAAGVSGENIGTTMQRVEDIMATIVTAFEKQLDALFGSEAMDISTDITVLETMLAREGLAGEPRKGEDSKDDKDGGSDIELKL